MDNNIDNLLQKNGPATQTDSTAAFHKELLLAQADAPTSPATARPPTNKETIANLMKDFEGERQTFRTLPANTPPPTDTRPANPGNPSAPIKPLPRVETPTPKPSPEKPRESSLEQSRAAFQKEMSDRKIPHYTASEYQTAIRRANETKLTLVVDSGYASCPHCVDLNNQVFKQMERAELGNAVFLHLDTTAQNYPAAINALNRGQIRRQIQPAQGAPDVAAYNASGERTFHQVGYGGGRAEAANYSGRLRRAIQNP